MHSSSRTPSTVSCVGQLQLLNNPRPQHKGRVAIHFGFVYREVPFTGDIFFTRYDLNYTNQRPYISPKLEYVGVTFSDTDVTTETLKTYLLTAALEGRWHRHLNKEASWTDPETAIDQAVLKK